MKKGRKVRISLVVFFTFCISSLVIAGNIAQQEITFQIDPINEISINGGANSLVIKGSGNGSGSTGWAITTNETNKRVVGIIDADMPPGITLYVQLEAPQGSLSSGRVAVTAKPQDLVTGISKVAEDNLGITYRLVTQPDANRVEAERVLTLVLTDGF